MMTRMVANDGFTGNDEYNQRAPKFSERKKRCHLQDAILESNNYA
jgi:hypothetical protein